MAYKNREDAIRYGKKYYRDHKEKLDEINKQWRQNNSEKVKQSIIKWRKNNPERYKISNRKSGKKHERKTRITILNIISGNNPHCVRCGCDDIRLLEINHKNGGGKKDWGSNPRLFYRDICKGIRKTDDLELLCKVCNAWHALELKYGKLPYNVTYKKEK